MKSIRCVWRTWTTLKAETHGFEGLGILMYSQFLTDSLRWTAVIRSRREAADADPANALSRYHAGISLYKLERFDEAPGHLSRAAQDSPSLRPHCRYVAGVCYYKTGRPEDALNLFTQVADDGRSGDLGGVFLEARLKIPGYRSSFLSMAFGKARFWIKKLPGFKQKEFKVKIKTAILGVRGSDFIDLEETQVNISTMDNTDLHLTLVRMFGYAKPRPIATQNSTRSPITSTPHLR